MNHFKHKQLFNSPFRISHHLTSLTTQHVERSIVWLPAVVSPVLDALYYYCTLHAVTSISQRRITDELNPIRSENIFGSRRSTF